MAIQENVRGGDSSVPSNALDTHSAGFRKHIKMWQWYRMYWCSWSMTPPWMLKRCCVRCCWPRRSLTIRLMLVIPARWRRSGQALGALGHFFKELPLRFWQNQFFAMTNDRRAWTWPAKTYKKIDRRIVSAGRLCVQCILQLLGHFANSAFIPTRR